MKTTFHILLAFASLGFGSTPLWAARASFELGTIYHSGPDEGSLAKKYGYLLAFKAQSEGSFRYEFGGQTEFVKGQVNYASGNAELRVIKALGTGALSLHPFHKSKISPFFGIQGLGGFAAFESALPPGDEPLSRTGYVFGYEAFVGADYSRRGTTAWRLRLGLRKMSTTYNNTALDLGGMVGTLSYVFPGDP